MCRTPLSASPESFVKSDTYHRLCVVMHCASVLLHMAPSGEKGTWRALGELSAIGMTLVVATVIGLAAGYYADRWLGTKPWLLLLGLGLGIAAGFVNLFRSVRRAEREFDDRG